MKNVEISTDISRLDIKFINAFISNSYWARGRTLETMQTCIDNSLNFGVYLQDDQIGYARIVTDYGHFAYIMDLFIQENYRGNGYSKKLMAFILDFEKLRNIKVWRLATNDAHELYRQFGFDKIAKPENIMELVK